MSNPRLALRPRMVLPVVLVLAAALSATAAQKSEETLYKRLGGYDAIAAVVDDFIGRLATDASLSRFFVGHSTDSLQKIRQLVVDQICEGAGGPCVYKGRPTKTSHAGLKITEKDWDSSVHHLTATLDKFKVPHKEKDEVLAFVSTLKKDIVESP